MIEAYPLAWPVGWPRTAERERKSAGWSKTERVYVQPGAQPETKYRPITLADGVGRVLVALERFGIDRQDAVISTNVRTRLDGLPRSGEPKPTDPGVAVYWRETSEQKTPRVMAIDIYDTVEGNMGAIAATLDAMRAIERHGGARILERAFTGFTALPAPGQTTTRGWREVLGFPPDRTPPIGEIRSNYKTLRSERHPDNGGSNAAFHEVQMAYGQALQEVGQ